jgi:hypothetical protein
MSPAWKILGNSLRHLWKHKKLFLGILAIYAVLNIVLVKGLANNLQVTNLKSAYESFGSNQNTFDNSLTLFSVLIGSSASTTGESGNVYQVFLLIVISLAIIWALRRTYEKEVKVRIRDSFYKGMYPFVPVILIILLIMVQMLPLIMGVSIYSTVQTGGIAVGIIEKAAWLCGLIAMIGLTVYFLSSSLFALYIVTLKDMTPVRALRVANKMVKYRRWTLIPLILVLPIAADIIYAVAAIFTLGIVHSYVYALYRELL